MHFLLSIFLVLWVQSYLFFWPQTVASILRGRPVSWFTISCGILGIIGVFGTAIVLGILGGVP